MRGDGGPLAVEIVPFDGQRPRNTFSCGRRPIDAWYKNHAKKCVKRAEYCVFEALVPQAPRPVGYYALQIGNESMSALENKPDDFTKNYTAFPAVHLAYLGVDEKFQGRGIGTAFLSDVFESVYKISQMAGLYALTLQSLDEDSTRFYRKLGFTPYSDHPTSPKMLIPLRIIIQLVEEA
ncbi:MAG: GNAT family N-acetyltransferase [Tistlia sp.]|uniref:GNAT family N-acetyltransferase n=1 Tax=Tistlia sp. TaxID=3057121 RepID=UPI0034A176E1